MTFHTHESKYGVECWLGQKGLECLKNNFRGKLLFFVIKTILYLFKWTYLSNTLTNLCIALYSIVLRRSQLYCIVNLLLCGYNTNTLLVLVFISR